MIDPAGHHIEGASLIPCLPGTDQRAAVQSRLHDQQAEGAAADDPVPLREGLFSRSGSHRELADHRAVARDNFLSQGNILLGIEVGESTAQNGDCPAIGSKSRLMSGRVDASCQAAIDRQPRVGELVAKLLRGLQGVVACLPRADDADTVPLVLLLQITQDIEHDRWVMDLFQEFGILGVRRSEDTSPGFLDQSQFGIQVGMLFPRGDD